MQSGFHLGISSWGGGGGSSQITWPYGHGERIIIIIIWAGRGGKLGRFGGEVELFRGKLPCAPLLR